MPAPKSFTNLVNNLSILPGVGEKTAERFVYSIFEKDIEEVENLADALIEFKKNIKNCSICGCITDDEICDICSDESRDKSTICVVEDSKSVFFTYDSNFCSINNSSSLLSRNQLILSCCIIANFLNILTLNVLVTEFSLAEK